jgi:OmpA family
LLAFFADIKTKFQMRKLALGFALCLNISLAWAQEVDWYGYFENDCDALSEKQIQTIHLWAASHYHLRDHAVEIRGHTDSNADSVYNLNLSERRAKSIFQILEQNGFTDCRFKFYGESMPLCNQPTEECLAVNRRVEVILYDTTEELWKVSHSGENAQVIFFNASEETFLEGEEGTIVHIPKGVLMDADGKEYTGDARAHLNEINSVYDCMMQHISTKSEGRLIESGGMCEIQIFDTRTNKKLSLNGSIEVLFPSQKNGKQEGMQTFVGVVRPNGMEWKRKAVSPKGKKNMDGQTSIGYKSEYYPGGSGIPKEKRQLSRGYIISCELGRLSKEEIQKFKRNKELMTLMVNAIQVNELGWLNCDRYISDNPLVSVKFDGVESGVNLFVVFEQRRVCIAVGKEGIQIPENEPITVYAYRLGEEKISFFKYATGAKAETIPITLNDYSPEAFRAAIEQTKQRWQ